MFETKTCRILSVSAFWGTGGDDVGFMLVVIMVIYFVAVASMNGNHVHG